MFKDRYTHLERRDILRDLWEISLESDLKPLRELAVHQVRRELAAKTGGDAIRAFCRFDVVIIRALLWTQHQVTLAEEEMSHSQFSSSGLNLLTEKVKNYGMQGCSLCELEVLRL